MRHLKAAAFAAAALFALAGCQKPAVDAAAVEAELKQGLRDFFVSFNAGDVDAVVAYYAPDAVVMAPGSPAATGQEAVRAIIVALSEQLRGAGLSLMASDGDVVGVSGDYAWHSGGYTVSDAGGVAVDSGNYVAVFQDLDGKWLMIRDIWNSDRPPAAAPAEGDAPL